MEDSKTELLEEFVARRSIGWSVHGATFKSPLAIENADRMVVQGATICGQSWVLLAVLDGGSVIVSRVLPYSIGYSWQGTRVRSLRTMFRNDYPSIFAMASGERSKLSSREQSITAISLRMLASSRKCCRLRSRVSTNTYTWLSSGYWIIWTVSSLSDKHCGSSTRMRR